jgi:predicted nucleic acid-binding protein
VRVVLDADVVIGALDGDDPHHKQARTLFRGWERQDATRLISVVNLTEVLVAPAPDRRRLRAAREAIAALEVAIHPPSEAIGVESARLRRAHPISLPDAYCLATARYTDARVASFDEKVLRAAEREGLTLAGTAAQRRVAGGIDPA